MAACPSGKPASAGAADHPHGASAARAGRLPDAGRRIGERGDDLDGRLRSGCAQPGHRRLGLLKRLGGERLLLAVDQFEELFTACKDLTERKQFIDNLLCAVAPETAGATILVITLRADFYQHCAQYENLRQALAQQQEYIGAMNAAELRQAIQKPAELGGWKLEDGLVDLLLRDVGEEPGALPLLSHALLETWKRRRGHTLTLAGYQAVGGVHGALAQTARHLYRSFSAEQQAVARRIFLRLTELGEGTQDTRRRAALNELASGAEQPFQVQVVLQALAGARLVTTQQDCAEVAHEALIREWPTLRGWLDEDRDGLRVQRHLTQAAAEWERRGRDPGDLYRGARLAWAQERAGEHAASLSAAESEFLRASREALRRERRVARLRWAGIGALALLAGLIAMLGVTGQLNWLVYSPALRPPASPEEWVTIPPGVLDGQHG